MQTRGVGNIEMILSFILFIGFVFIALFFFTPGGGNSRIIDSSLNYALSAVSNNVSVPLLTYSVKFDNTVIPPRTKTIAIDFSQVSSNIPSDYNVHVENYTGSEIAAVRSGNTVYVEWNNNPFVLVEFSQDFTPNSSVSSYPASNQNYYTIASSSSRNIISEKRFLELNSSYYNQYDSLKQELNMPGQVDFGFGLKYDNGLSIQSQKQTPSGINVYSALTRREATLQNTNTLAYADFSVEVW